MNNTHIKIEQGANGDEPRSFRGILLKMYTNWARMNGLSWTVQEEDTFVLVTIDEDVYGKLCDESGVHRLTRISPLDSRGRRYTSFCRVSVYGEEIITVSWDNQVRSYILHPNKAVKEHKHGYEVLGDDEVQRVLEGEIQLINPLAVF